MLNVLWPTGTLGEALEMAQARITGLFQEDSATATGPPSLVQVLPIDLVSGFPRDGCNCPLQRAVQRLLAPGWKVEVGPRTALFYKEDHSARHLVSLPSAARNFVYWYDDPAHGLLFQVKPFAFPLYIPAECRETGEAL